MKNCPFEEGIFRDFYHEFIFIECKEVMAELGESVEVMEDADGVLAYGIIESNQGTTFALLNSAKILGDGTLEMGPSIYNEEDIPRLRFGDVQYYTFSSADEYKVDTSIYEEVAAAIREDIETKDQLLRNIYDLEIIDYSRDAVAPDFVTVIVNRELIWARIIGFGPDYIIGEAFTPTMMVGNNIAKGQVIAFRIVEVEDRTALYYDPGIELDVSYRS